MDFELQDKTPGVLNGARAGSEGARPEVESRGKTVNPLALTSVSDWAQLTRLQLERRRV